MSERSDQGQEDGSEELEMLDLEAGRDRGDKKRTKKTKKKQSRSDEGEDSSSSSSSSNETEREEPRSTVRLLNKSVGDEEPQTDDADLDKVGAKDDAADAADDEEDPRARFQRMRGESKLAMLKPQVEASLEFRHINYYVKFPAPPMTWWGKILNKVTSLIPYFPHKKMKRQILNDLSGQVRTGELLAIMGPTGSGKTSLLSILAGRVSTGVSGQVLVNGRQPGPATKRLMAYVLQDDVFFTNLTVKQTLNFTAWMKLPRAMTFKEKCQRVRDVMAELGIEKCQNTVIGNPFMRGISGGERKRTNIGNELLMNPSLILLDEPTSGLDSATALNLVLTLKELAKSGRTVITTIHQPSSPMFKMFDKVLLLAEGRIAYYGEAKNVVSYFSKLGYQCEPHYNPADFMLELVTTNADSGEEGKSIREVICDYYEEEKLKDVPDDVMESERGRIGKVVDKVNPLAQMKKRREEEKALGLKHRGKYPTWFHTQFLVLTLRAFTQYKSEVFSMLAWVQTIAIALIVGFVWFQISYNEDAIKDRQGMIFFQLVFWSFYSWFNALYSFPPERAVLNKERQSGSYRLSAYFLGKSVSELPIQCLLPSTSVIITYWMCGLNPSPDRFFIHWVMILLTTFLGSSIGLLIGALVLDTKRAVVLSSILILGIMLLGGFYVNPDNFPVWVSWIQWAAYLKYAYEGMLINEFKDSSERWKPSNPSAYPGTEITGEEILDKSNVKTEIWYDFIIIAGMTLIIRFVAYLALRFLNKPKK